MGDFRRRRAVFFFKFCSFKASLLRHTNSDVIEILILFFTNNQRVQRCVTFEFSRTGSSRKIDLKNQSQKCQRLW